MAEDPYPNILDRTGPQAFLAEHFSDQLKVLEEIVNYGTNLFVRCWTTGPRRFEDLIVLGELKQAVSMLDGFHVLMSAGAVHAAKLQQRAVLEAYLSLAWMLESDTETRCRHFHVWYLRRQRARLLRFQAGTSENQTLQEDLAAGRIPLDPKTFPQAASEVASHISRIDRILGGSPYREISAEFDGLPKWERHPAWYRLSGPKNLREVAHKLKERAAYDVFYVELSDVAHAVAMERQLTVGKGDVVFEHIRDLKEFNRDFRLTAMLALPTYGKVLRHYRPDEGPHLARKYVTEWRDRLNSGPEITFNTTYVDF